MLRSMYSGVSGMKGFQTKLDVIGNNIANVNTAGYKKSTVNFQDLLNQNMSGSGTNPLQVGLGSKASSINTIYTAGSTMTTGVNSDLSIMGDGFFVVQDPNNVDNKFLTRSGNFVVNANGELVTAQGYQVLDEDGAPIEGLENVNFSIGSTGGITGKRADGTDITRINIGIFSPPNPAGLSKVGGSMYQVTNASGGELVNGNIESVAEAGTQIGSGMLEMSNVDLTEEFTEMIIAQRGFQANSRTITTSDEILQEVVNLKR